MTSEADIMHENSTHWVLRTATGFEVLRKGLTHSTRCAVFGRNLPSALSRAIADADKRHAAQSVEGAA
jgi:hypothetical protein